ncbi:peptidylprolyl isomerase [Planctomycetota bacterium]
MRTSVLIVAVLAVLGGIGLTVGLLLRSSEDTRPAEQVDTGAEAPRMPLPFGFETPVYRRTGVIRFGFSGAGRSREEARDIARRVHGMLSRKELEFGVAAERFSDHASQAQEGDLGFVTREDIYKQNLPGAELTEMLNTGQISEVIGSESTFAIYKILPYERKYFRVSFVHFGEGEGDLSADDARSKAYQIYNNIMANRGKSPGPVGYIGEVIAGVPHKMVSPDSIFHEEVKELKEGELSGVFQDGQHYVIAQRCAPIQFTFSFIMFPGNTDDSAELKRLTEEARQAHAQMKDNPGDFYRFARAHYQKGKWNTPWYRISKDLYLNELKKDVYDFLRKARPGDVSNVLAFDAMVIILMKEEFIPHR